MDVLEIDGSYGEGGGQILRTALALSAVLGQPVHICNIRARRPRPGLQPQHLAGVQLLQRITSASVRGAVLDSTDLHFEPKEIRGGRYTINVGTAGAVSLVIQTVLLPLLFADAPSTVRIIGGTDVEHAPTVDYVQNVLLPWVSRLGGSASLEIVRRGYYPKGGGEVVLHVEPVEDRLKPLVLTEFKKDFTINGVSHSGALPEHVAQRQADAARKRLEDSGYSVGDISVHSYPRSEVLCPGSGITLWVNAMPIGASSLGARGVLAEVVGKRAANHLVHQLDVGAPVDLHMGDQLVPFLALANGSSELRITEGTMHLVTNLWVVEQFLGKIFEVNREEGRRVYLRIDGVAHKKRD